MYIKQIAIKNFRLLKETTLDLREDTSLLLGRNNCGKTSFLVLFENFYFARQFNYNDFPVSLRDKLTNLVKVGDGKNLRIQMKLEIYYDKADNLETLSEFIVDLDPAIQTVKILFECSINEKLLLKDIEALPIGSYERQKFIIKNISKYLKRSIYTYDDESHLSEENRHFLVEKDLESFKRIVNLQVVHAKRDIASSEGSQNKKALSVLATEYFNKENKADKTFAEINAKMIEMDTNLDLTYGEFFKPFLKHSREMLGFEDLKVRSNIQSNELLENSSEVIYGSEENHLPEHLNGLGFMNMLYLMLIIEIKKTHFRDEERDINLLFIEEPEAHTHPQMQYIFANKIKSILQDVKNLQTVITTHSSHIVSQCDFEDIRYLSRDDVQQNVVIKNFHTELSAKYEKPEDFKFLKQYLTLQSAELFFACKIIFIEGTSERIMFPYFVKQFDQSIADDPAKFQLSSQNISILEVGCNARAFFPFLEFLGIKSLIITDIDTTRAITNADGIVTKQACEVALGEDTSNHTLKHVLKTPKKPADLPAWITKLKDHTLSDGSTVINVAYQSKEAGYHARSFEDAFISLNLPEIKKQKDNLWGLKNKHQLDSTTDVFELTNKIIDKKTDFASSLLYLALSKEAIAWKTPEYLMNGLKWLAE